MSFEAAEETDKGHGRIERRRCTITGDTHWLRERHPHWRPLRSVIEIEATREIKGGGDRPKSVTTSAACHPARGGVKRRAAALGHREPTALGAGRQFRRRPKPHSQGSRPAEQGDDQKDGVERIAVDEEAAPASEFETHAQTRRLESRFHDGCRDAGEILMRRPWGWAGCLPRMREHGTFLLFGPLKN